MNKIALRAFGASALALMAMLGACSDNDFKIKGDITDADNEKIILEKADFSGFWSIVDSTRTDKDGRFNFSVPRQSGPEIFRLALGDRFIYLPVDSTETITVSSSLAGFGHEFSLDGSEQARNMEAFEKDLLAFAPNFDIPDSLDNFKKHVYNNYLHDAKGSIVSYYILTKTVGNRLLFDPATEDFRYITAVANSFDHFRPDDAHTPILKQLAMAGRSNHNELNGIKTIIEATEVSVLEIELDDENGKTQKLTDRVGKGKPVIVAFTLMRDGVTPDINRQLAEIYNSGRADIYNVSPDPDQYGWRESVKNLPWTTVLDPSAGQHNVFLQYNVGQLPMFYLYDSAGDLVARSATVKGIKEKL